MNWVASGRLLEAVHDDEALAAVVGELAARLGARSFFGAFGLEGALEGVAVNNSWWTADQIALYESEFLAWDPCAHALLANWRPQQVIDLDRAIGDGNFERSRLYQDFIRPMGDDTFRALGVPFETAWGKGAITFQRGQQQPRFGNAEIALLSSAAGDLARLFALRAKLSGVERMLAGRSAALDALEQALVFVRADGRLLHANRAGDALLRRARFLGLRAGRVCAAGRGDQAGFEALLGRMAAPNAGPGSGMRLVAADGAGADLVAVRVPDGSILLTINVPAGIDRARMLREIYGLSAAEADVALRIAAGETVEEIAMLRGTSRNTVRLQVRGVSEKMGCSRQVEIAARVVALPGIALPDLNT